MNSKDSTQEEEHTEVKTILVVEDDDGIGEFLVQAIQQETPYQALLAPDGGEALRMMDSLKPNLLILDYSLPDMSGIELYDQIQGMKEHAGLPALIISAHAPSKALKERRLSLLKKPFELADLLKTIEKLLARLDRSSD